MKRILCWDEKQIERNEGFCGVGIGSNLYNKKWIQNKDFDGLRALAKAYVDAMGENK